MIRTQYQEDNGSNSSPTLEVGVFLLKEDKENDIDIPNTNNTLTCNIAQYLIVPQIDRNLLKV